MLHPPRILLFALAAMMVACSQNTFVRPEPTAAPAAPTVTSAGTIAPVCDNPYLPFQPGAYWVYRQSQKAPNGKETVNTLLVGVYDVMTKEITSTVRLAIAKVNGVTRTFTSVPCDADAGIQPTRFRWQDGAPDSHRLFYLALPPAAKLAPGFKWQGLAFDNQRIGTGFNEKLLDVNETFAVTGNAPVVVKGSTHAGLEITKSSRRVWRGCGYPPSACSAEDLKNPMAHIETDNVTVVLTFARDVGLARIVEMESHDGSPGIPRTSELTDFGVTDALKYRNAWGLYRDEKLGFQVEYPAIFDQEPYKHSECAFYFSDSDKGGAHFEFTPSWLNVALNYGRALDDYVQEFIAVRRLPSSQVNMTRVRAQDLQGIQLEYSTNTQHAYSTFFKSGGTVYEISTARESSFQPRCDLDMIGLNSWDAYLHLIDTFRVVK